MSYEDERLNQIRSETNQLRDVQRQLRNQEQSLKARAQYLSNPQSFPTASVQNLKKGLGLSLAPHMMPGNVGGYNEVTWPFYFQANADFGENPVLATNNIQKTFFQVDQEASFLIMSVSRSHNTDSSNFSALINAPVQVEFIDRQSSRRFQSQPIPLQMIGDRSLPMIFPTPFYLQPNAILDIEISGIPDPSVPQTFTGDGSVQFSFFGYRIRTEDAGQILSTIFCAP